MRRLFRKQMQVDPRECEEVRATFSDYLDGELGADAAARIEQHVGFCPRCRQALTNLRLTLRSLGHLGKTEEPGDREAAERARRAFHEHAD